MAEELKERNVCRLSKFGEWQKIFQPQISTSSTIDLAFSRQKWTSFRARINISLSSADQVSLLRKSCYGNQNVNINSFSWLHICLKSCDT